MGGMISRDAPELKDAQVTIVGLGLMGGSLALALQSHVAALAAVEPDPQTRRLALERGIVQTASAALAEGLREADLVILATPVGAILNIIQELPRLRADGCYLLDVGSTKAAICAAMDRLPKPFAAVGGHPMCGKETAGLAFADASLYQRQTFVLCPTTRTTESIWRLAQAVIEKIGALSLSLPPEVHDQRVALLSHLPYLVAANLMRLAAAKAGDDAQYWAVSAAGFRDTSRLAGSDAAMMLDIIETNRDAILHELRRFAAQTGELIRLVESDDSTRLQAWLRATQEEHVRYRRARDAVRERGA